MSPFFWIWPSKRRTLKNWTKYLKNSRPSMRRYQPKNSNECWAVLMILSAQLLALTPAPVGPKPRTGRRCFCGCTCAGLRNGSSRIRLSTYSPVRRRALRALLMPPAARMLTAYSKPKRAYTAWCAYPLLTPAVGAIPLSRRYSSTLKWKMKL